MTKEISCTVPGLSSYTQGMVTGNSCVLQLKERLLAVAWQVLRKGKGKMKRYGKSLEKRPANSLPMILHCRRRGCIRSIVEYLVLVSAHSS